MPPAAYRCGQKETGGEGASERGGRSERALTPRDNARSLPLRTSSQRRTPRYWTACDPRLLFPAKSLPTCAIMGMTRFASPRVRRPAAPRLLSSSPCAGRLTARMAGISSVLARADKPDRPTSAMA